MNETTDMIDHRASSSAPLYTEETMTQPRQSSSIPFPSCRLIVVFLGFLGFVNVYCLRVNLSVAIVAMVNHSIEDSSTNASGSTECKPDQTNSSTSLGNGEFNWNSNVQGAVLAAFFYGYITTQVIGGRLAEHIGGKWLLGGGVLCTAVLTLLTTIAARWHVGVLIALRVLEGMGEGVTFPSMHALLACWIPPHERSRAITFVYAGAQLGTIIGMPLTGLLCASDLMGGWPSAFYVFGIAGCVWAIVWFICVFDSPAKHPRISTAERQYLEAELGTTKHHVKRSTPWRAIFTSKPVWACAAGHFANNWGFYMLLTCLPKYMHDILGFNITQNALLSGLPYLASWLMMIVGGVLADCMRAPGRLSTGAVRKIMCGVGLLSPAVLLIATGFVGCDQVVVVVLVIAAVGSSALTMAGYGVNHLDLAPAYAGSLMGLTNTLATIPGFVAPQVVGALTYNQSTRGQWQKVFYLTGGILGAGTIVFSLFGSGNLQPWSTTEVTRDVDDANETENLLVEPELNSDADLIVRDPSEHSVN